MQVCIVVESDINHCNSHILFYTRIHDLYVQAQVIKIMFLCTNIIITFCHKHILKSP